MEPPGKVVVSSKEKGTAFFQSNKLSIAIIVIAAQAAVQAPSPGLAFGQAGLSHGGERRFFAAGRDDLDASCLAGEAEEAHTSGYHVAQQGSTR